MTTMQTNVIEMRRLVLPPVTIGYCPTCDTRLAVTLTGEVYICGFCGSHTVDVTTKEPFLLAA